MPVSEWPVINVTAELTFLKQQFNSSQYGRRQPSWIFEIQFFNGQGSYNLYETQFTQSCKIS